MEGVVLHAWRLEQGSSAILIRQPLRLAAKAALASTSAFALAVWLGAANTDGRFALEALSAAATPF